MVAKLLHQKVPEVPKKEELGVDRWLPREVDVGKHSLSTLRPATAVTDADDVGADGESGRSRLASQAVGAVRVTLKRRNVQHCQQPLQHVVQDS